MRRTLLILLFVSLAINLVFKIVNNGRDHYYEQQNKILFYKKISYEAGYKSFENVMSRRHPSINLRQKNTIVCFWDSMVFEHIGIECMKNLDSLAGTLGKYSYNYVFATEMKEKDANDYLKRNYVNNEHFVIAGDMDDFISGVFNNYNGGINSINIFNGDTVKDKAIYHQMQRHKHKPYYLIMDTAGNIVYNNNRFFLPSKDTAFLRRVKEGILTKALQNL